MLCFCYLARDLTVAKLSMDVVLIFFLGGVYKGTILLLKLGIGLVGAQGT